MPQIETKDEKVRKLAGLHLYHDPLSSCAMRVRMVLAEKNLPWENHVVDLAKMEHATPEYQSINPNGLVPTLIHDGRTYIESIDIIQYLDELAAAPSLTPVDPKEPADCRSLTVSADGAQVALKTLTHEFLFRGSGRYLGEEDQKKFATAHRNTWLVDFKRAFAARDAKWQAQVSAALATMNGHFRDLNGRLATNKWLIDGSFTLADAACRAVRVPIGAPTNHVHRAARYRRGRCRNGRLSPASPTPAPAVFARRDHRAERHPILER